MHEACQWQCKGLCDWILTTVVVSPSMIGRNRRSFVHLSIIELVSVYNRYLFSPGGSVVVSAIRRNWNRVSPNWQIAVDYRICPSLITGDLVLRAGSIPEYLKPCSESYWISLSAHCRQRRLFWTTSWLISIHYADIIQADEITVLSRPRRDPPVYYL